MRDDTIVAIATPPGEGGIGIVRLSGPEAAVIGARLFSGRLRDHRAVIGQIRDPANGEVIDEAIGLLMRGPRTYTREDTVELQAHGSLVCLQRIVQLSLREGARLAEPGEFTLRAFLNGRLDLAQAEAVLDVIKARTEASLRLAVQGLGGRLSRRIGSIRAELVDLLAYLSARADFPDEDVPRQDIGPALAAVLGELDVLIATADRGMIYRQGTHVAIVGSPNVGKSSLMNRLLREDRTIVTEIPGTTRDTVSEMVNLGGVPVILTDTAGLELTLDPVEQMGIERSHEAIDRSDLLLIVLEHGRDLSRDELHLIAQTESRPWVIAVNKCDLRGSGGPLVSHPTAIYVSALSGAGINDLEERLAAVLTGGEMIGADTAVVTNPRHRAALIRARDCLVQTQAVLGRGLPEDLIGAELRTAIEALGEITGDTVTEELLDSIFRNFCIGK